MIIENFNIKAVRRALGLELKNVRLERALSQEQLSEAASISTKDINTMEAGKGYLISGFRRLLKFYGKKVRIEIVD
jgi:hypothetical protein